jgi:hypothetical protein
MLGRRRHSWTDAFTDGDAEHVSIAENIGPA